MAKTINQGICDWFFKVVEAQRKLNALEDYYRNGKELVGFCGGNNKVIHICYVQQFDRLVEALISVRGKEFVGDVKEEVAKIPNGGFIWRSFKYAEFDVGVIVERLEEEKVND